MKITNALLAFALIQGTSAFMVGAPKTHGQMALRSYSYLGNDAESAPKDTRTTSGSAPVPGASQGGKMAAGKPGAKPAPEMGIGNIWDTLTPITVQGGSLRTWSFQTPAVERVQVFLKTEGRPLNADIDLWQGPDNTPEKMRVYIEDGSLRTFSAVIETPRGHNAVAIRNTGHLEFPLAAAVEANVDDTPVTQRISPQTIPKTIQGGAIKTYPFSPYVENVKVLLRTDGRPLNARIELLQGPNNNKQVIEVYTEDGFERPFFLVLETPGVGNVVRVVNTAPVEFPMTASVEAYPFEKGIGSEERVDAGGPVWEVGSSSFGGGGFYSR
jgi:hypothetical protein